MKPGTGRRRRRMMADAGGRCVWRVWDVAQRLGTIRSGTSRARRFGAFGDNSAVCFPVAALVGEDRIAIGSDTVIGPYSTVSAGLPGQPPNPWWAGPTLVVGDRCVIGRNATITAHREVRIGDDVWTGNDVFISDQNHGWSDPDRPIGEQAQEPRAVTIGDGCWIGHGAVILPGVTIGRRVVIAAGAVVTQSVPDHAVAAGVPARVVGSTLPSGTTAAATLLPGAPESVA